MRIEVFRNDEARAPIVIEFPDSTAIYLTDLEAKELVRKLEKIVNQKGG